MLRHKFKINIGYSDHSEGILVSIAAYLLGATIIERHLTLNRKLKGPDHSSSLEPHEFKELALKIKRLYACRGVNKSLLAEERLNIN